MAERPEELVVYGGIGRAARNWECFEAIVATLKRLEANQTLLIQSGKPVGVFETHADAPRVLLANSNLVPRWSSDGGVVRPRVLAVSRLITSSHFVGCSTGRSAGVAPFKILSI